MSAADAWILVEFVSSIQADLVTGNIQRAETGYRVVEAFGPI